MRKAEHTRFIDRISTSQQCGLLALFLLLCSSAFAYYSLARGLPGDFMLDDRGRIVNVNVESATFQGVAEAIMNTDSGTFGRILPLASFFITKSLYGNDAEIFKHHNILLHLISGLLVFWFIGRLFSSGRFSQLCPTQSPWLFAAIVSSLWLLHPIQVSTALYTVQRMTQLSLIFTLLALISYLYMRSAFASNVRRAILPFIGVALFMIAGLLSKETAALVPFYILLIEYFVFRFNIPTTRVSLPYFTSIALFCIVPILAGFIYFFTHIDTLLHDYAMRPFTLTERIATEAVVMWRYVGMLLVPRLSDFSLYHDGISIASLLSLKSLLALTCWLALLAVLVRFRNRDPVLVFGIAWFLVSHLFESTILPLELMFEHRNYAGSIGIIVALSAVLLRLRHYLPAVRKISLVSITVLIFSFAIMQATRASNWSDPYTYSIISAMENPASVRAASSLANNQARRGQIEEAKEIIRTAIDHRPHDGQLSGLYLHLAMFHCYDERIPGDVLDRSMASLESDPASAYALNALKILRERMLNDECPALSRPTLLLLESSAARNERTRLAYRMFFNGMAGVTSVELGHYKAARTYFDRALQYTDHVSDVTRRDALVVYARACIGDKHKTCAEEMLERAKSANEALVPMIKSHQMLPHLEEMYRDTFTKDSDKSSHSSQLDVERIRATSS